MHNGQILQKYLAIYNMSNYNQPYSPAIGRMLDACWDKQFWLADITHLFMLD